MNVSENDLIRKKKPARLRPTHREGLRIQYGLKDAGESFAGIGRYLKISPQIVANVIFGRRRSARVEAEIARLLGKANWNEVVLEARSEVQKKPVKVILQEMEQKARAQRKAAAERMADYASENRERVDRIISEGLATAERRRAWARETNCQT